ncbi:MAG: Fic family protein [Acidobacteria bacterium]|nr:MAG: Fic family protein [Acidobacteriota bacterium]
MPELHTNAGGSPVPFDPLVPYNDLPLVPPAEDLETKEVLKKCISAHRALAELKGAGQTIPNQGMLINTLVLQEARSSSEIENIVTTDDAVFQALATSGSADPAIKEVLRYREAIKDAFESVSQRPLLSTNLFVRIAQTIRENQAGIRNVPGTAIRNLRTGAIVYTPPEGEGIIRDKLRNLEEYIHNENGVDHLVKLAVVHYQFEAIHPFTDGNGRTGRIINILFLVQRGLLELPVLYLSKYIIEKKSDYYRLLREVTQSGDWESWILYMLDAIEQTALHTRRKIQAIRRLLDQTLREAKEKVPSRVYSKDLVELLFFQPYTKVQYLVEAGIAKRQTASEYLKQLERVGLLIPRPSGKEKLYLNQRLLDLLSS